MKLTILGSGTGIPSARRAYPGILIQRDGTHILVDSGPGTLRQLQKIGVYPDQINFILYTHLHPDHSVDLISFLFASKYEENPRQAGLNIVSGRGFRKFLDEIRRIYNPCLEPDNYHLNISEVYDDRLDFKGFTLYARPMNHTDISRGFRIETPQGKSITISGDTDYCKNIITLAKNTDLLVLECSFPNARKVEGHLTPAQAGQIAAAANCARLLLTHMYPVCDHYDLIRECRQHYQGEIIVAEDLMELEV